jgi:hypothetical protein
MWLTLLYDVCVCVCLREFDVCIKELSMPPFLQAANLTLHYGKVGNQYFRMII